jgi:predicted permease
MGLRYAFRTLRRSPGFVLVAILTLSLGIGINTTVFSIYESVALKPIAARAPKQLVRISGTQGDRFSWQEYDEIRAHSRSLSGVIATSTPQTFSGTSQVFQARLVSDSYFDVLGVTAHLGRGFVPGEREAVVLSHDFWQGAFDGDAAIVGRSLRVQGVDLTVVGVAPEKFAGTGVPPRMPDLWIPLAAQPELMHGVEWQRNPDARPLEVLGRLAPGAAADQASAELDILGRTWDKVDGQPQRLRARAATFFQTDTGEFETFGQVCAVLMVAVGLILAIGGINLVNLLFARHATREREFAVRLSLGAGRRQLIRQLCTESVLVSLAGGAVGLSLSLFACDWIRTVTLRALERVSGGALGFHLDLAPDWRVFAYTAALSLLAGLAIGVWPALQASNGDVHVALKRGGGGSEQGYRGLWTRRNLLVSAQVAACLMLLDGAALLFQGAWRSGSVDPGFEMKHLLVVGVDPSGAASTAAARDGVIRKLRERIAALPQVASVAEAFNPPLLGHASAQFETETGKNVPCGDNVVSSGYFATLGVPLLAGRDFRPEEAEQRAPVVLISERAAREAWPGQNPLGREIKLPPRIHPEVRVRRATVIGVVANVHSTFLSKPDQPFVYFPGPLGNELVRTRTSPGAAARAVLETLSEIDPRLPASTFVISMEDGPFEVQRMMAEAPATASIILGTLALVLAAVGVFGLVWQLVARRTREIAIRMALGAGRRDVTKLVLAQTLRPVALGAAAGLAGAAGVSALLARMVVAPDMPDLTYGVGAFQPLAFCVVLAVLAAVVVAACLGPLRTAARIAPADALRME